MIWFDVIEVFPAWSSSTSNAWIPTIETSILTASTDVHKENN